MMTIKEVSEKYDISTDTIRYYERIGLLPPIPRKSNGIRDFDEASCNWIEFIKCMRMAGVRINSLIDYIKLFHQEGTAEARKEILKDERDRLLQKVNTINSVIERLNKKVDRYEEIIIPKENKLKKHSH